MSNPNHTVAAFRNSRTVKVYESMHMIRTRNEAEVHAEETRAKYPRPRFVVRVGTYTLGPRGRGTRYWTVRAYDRGE